MLERVTIEFVERPDADTIRVLEAGLDEHSKSIAGLKNETPFSLLMKDASGAIVGGVFAVAFWSGLAIDLFWIAAEYRGSGNGGQLLLRAEEEGRLRGANKAFLNTHTFQAPGFYEKYGYKLYGELKDFPPGHDRRYYVKTLEPITE